MSRFGDSLGSARTKPWLSPKRLTETKIWVGVLVNKAGCKPVSERTWRFESVSAHFLKTLWPIRPVAGREVFSLET